MITPEQAAARMAGIGASECADVLGIGYHTPYELWLIKTGRVEREGILDDSRTRLRNAHEQTIADEYAIQNNVKLQRVNNTIYHKKFPWMFCHLDRVIVGQKKIVECKSSMSFMKKFWGESGTDEVPLNYIVQMQHQYACSGYNEGDIALLSDIDSFGQYPIARDEALIKEIEERVSHFWNHHVLQDIAPEATTRGDLKHMFPTNDGNLLDATEDMINLLAVIKNHKLIIKQEDEVLSGKEIELIKLIGTADGIKDENGVLVTYKANKNGVRSLRLTEKK